MKGNRRKASVATQTSNSEHQSIFYGIRVPNLMPPRIKLDKKKTPSAFLLPGAACRGVAQGRTRPGPPIFIYSLSYLYAALS